MTVLLAALGLPSYVVTVALVCAGILVTAAIAKALMNLWAKLCGLDDESWGGERDAEGRRR